MALRAFPLLLIGILIGAPTHAETLSGLCPDGSAFVVQHANAVPCRDARFVEPADMPPLRPQFLPRPYMWQIDREARNPDNPYNLVERVRRLRELRAYGTEAAGPPREVPGTTTPQTSSPSAATAGPGDARAHRAFGLALADAELGDLLELVELRQQPAPARIKTTNVTGSARFQISFAYSAAFEAQALEALGVADRSRVLVFSLYAHEASEFHPNFFVLQREITFWPEPQDPREVGLLVGEFGAIPAGNMLLGYLVIPAHFDLGSEMALYWNDHSASALLVP